MDEPRDQDGSAVDNESPPPEGPSLTVEGNMDSAGQDINKAENFKVFHGEVDDRTIEGDLVEDQHSGPEDHRQIENTLEQEENQGVVVQGQVDGSVDNRVQHGDVQHGDVQHGDVQLGDVQHGDVQHGDVQHGDQDNRVMRGSSGIGSTTEITPNRSATFTTTSSTATSARATRDPITGTATRGLSRSTRDLS